MVTPIVEKMSEALLSSCPQLALNSNSVEYVGIVPAVHTSATITVDYNLPKAYTVLIVVGPEMTGGGIVITWAPTSCELRTGEVKGQTVSAVTTIYDVAVMYTSTYEVSRPNAMIFRCTNIRFDSYNRPTIYRGVQYRLFGII